MRGAAVRSFLVHSLIGFYICAPQAAIELPSAVQAPPKRVRNCTLCFAGAGVARRRCASSPMFFFSYLQAAIEAPSAMQTPPKRVSSCILCSAGAGGAGRRCAGSPPRPLQGWGVLLIA